MGQKPPDLATDFEMTSDYTMVEGGTYRVRGYVVLAILLQILVDFLLILASKRMLSEYIHPVRGILGALVGGICCTACLIPGLGFLNGRLWYFIRLGLVCLVCFGIDPGAIKAAWVYSLLRIALDGIGGSNDKIYTLLWVSLFCGICLLGLYGSRQKAQLLPVELCWGEKKTKLQALVDTGHSLRDPVTGRPVLIVDADVAEELTGLSQQQLAKPVESIRSLPGLRLIPYKTVGQSQGMLLAMQMKNGRIGNRKMNLLVAFAPHRLDESGKFQALIGGSL